MTALCAFDFANFRFAILFGVHGHVSRNTRLQYERTTPAHGSLHFRLTAIETKKLRKLTKQTKILDSAALTASAPISWQSFCTYWRNRRRELDFCRPFQLPPDTRNSFVRMHLCRDTFDSILLLLSMTFHSFTAFACLQSTTNSIHARRMFGAISV